MYSWQNLYMYITQMDRDSSVGIATRYGLDGHVIECRWGRQDFPHLSRPALGPTQPPIQWVSGLSPGVKRPGRGVDHPPQSSAEVKERVGLYLYFPFGPSWPVLGWTLPLPLPLLSWRGSNKNNQLPATTNVCKTRGCNYSFCAPDDKRCVARNMLSH